jgi:hypothetical protein
MKLSTNLKKVSKAADSLGDVPIIGEMSRGLGWVTGVAGSIASAFGWSKPTQLLEVAPVARGSTRYFGNCNGADLANPVAVDSQNELQITEMSVYEQDEMSIDFLKKIPWYTPLTSWSFTTAVGTSLYSFKLCPGNMSTVGTPVSHGGHSTSFVYTSPLYYLGQLFTLWRGSLDIRIKLIKTPMHSGKLLITWTPATSVGTTPTLATSTYSLRHIIDVREHDVISLNLPYLVAPEYLNVNTFLGNYYSGQLDVIVLNPLRGPNNAPDTIDIFMEVTGGDDFEFAAPGNCQVVGMIPFLPQADEIVCDVIGGQKKYEPTLQPSKMCIGERILSVKQLLLRQSQMFLYNNTWTSLLTTSDMSLYPQQLAYVIMDGTTGVLAHNGASGDIYNFINSMYLFNRGSVKITMYYKSSTDHVNGLVWPNNTLAINAYPVNTYSYGYGSDVNVPTANLYYTSSTTVPVAVGLSDFVAESGPGICSVKVPYYNKWRLSPNFYTGTVGARKPDVNPNVDCLFTTGDSSITLGSLKPNIYRSVGDDFQCGFFIATPPLAYNYT